MYKNGCRILMFNGTVFILIGLFLTFLNGTPIFGIFNSLLEPVFDGFRSFSPDAMRFQSLTWTFIGMFHIIWGIFIISVTRNGLAGKRERWAWVSIVLSIVTWLSIDLYFSLSTGMYLITFNPMTAFFIVLLVVPLFMTRQAFFKDPT